MMQLGDLGDELCAQVVASCRARQPDTTGILVHGSYATGRAETDSDLDLSVFVGGEPTVPYRTWFEQRPGAPPLHVSARSDLTLPAWEAESREPEAWALGMPVELPHVWLWAGDGDLIAALGEQPVLRKPGAEPEIEDMVDAVLKMRRHARSGDDLGARLEAQVAGRCAAPTVAALNAPGAVSDPRSALTAVLDLHICPAGWAEDLVVCLGLSDAAADGVVVAADRLVSSTLQLVRRTNPRVDPQPDVARFVADGTFERLLRGS